MRLKASFDRFVDADAMSDREVAALLRELEIDIAVDLNGLHRAVRDRASSPSAGARSGQLSRLCRHARPGLLRLHHRGSVRDPRRAARRTTPRRSSICPIRFMVNDSRAQDLRSARRRAPRRGCPRRASCSAASTTTTRSRPTCSTSGCGCCGAGRRQRAVAARAPTRRGRRICGARPRARRRSRRGWCLRRDARSTRITWRAIGSPTCSSTRCTTTPIRPRAMRCGPGCRC